MSDANTVPCFHCGLPTDPDTPWTTPIDGRQRPMCCPGCQAAAAAIDGLGLADFYRHRTAMPPTARELSAERAAEYAVYDQPELEARYIADTGDGRRETFLLVEGMNCAACTWLLEKTLQACPGVERAEVSLDNHQARVIWRRGEGTLGEFLAAIHRTGYTAQPWSQEARRAADRSEEKRMLIGLGIAGVGTMQVMMYAIALYAGALQGISDDMRDLLRWSSLAIASVVVLVSARPFFSEAWRMLRNRALGMDVPVAIAIGGAWIASAWATFTGTGEVYFDSVCMFTFFLLCGRYLEARARRRSARFALPADRLLPVSAWQMVDRVPRVVAADALAPGDLLLVRPGQVVAADGRVEEGRSHVDESLLTGEFTPVARGPGDPVTAGTLNVESPLQVRISAAGRGTRAAAIERMLAGARADRPRIVRSADRVASAFVAAVLVTACAVWLFWHFRAPAEAFWITLSVLVITCPCALSLATPAALTAATGALRGRGFIVAGGEALESLARASHVVFDKTGTLTAGALVIEEIHALADTSTEDCLRLAASLEAHATHPVAAAFVNAATPGPASQVRQVAGQGVSGDCDGRTLRLGRAEFVARPWNRPPPTPPTGDGTWILLGDGAQALAWFRLMEPLRADARESIRELRALGLGVSMLSGDRTDAVAALAARTGIDDHLGDCGPERKLAFIDALQQSGQHVVMVGDGINDAPGLDRALVSVAMGGGAELTRARADVVVASDRLADLPRAIRHARRTQAVIGQNLAWALGYNLLALPAAAAGLVPPWAAAIGMSASSLAVTLNALRLSRLRDVEAVPGGSGSAGNPASAVVAGTG